MRRAHGRTDTRRIALTTAGAAAVLALTALLPGTATAAEHPAGPAAPAAGTVGSGSVGSGSVGSGTGSAPEGMRQLSSFTVAFPAAPYRTHNIARAVELIDGAVVRPGETWSFNTAVGERTEQNGFVDGIMINDGRYVKAPGGGVSAVATTMYNAMFFAGLAPVEHGAHSFYIERYPEGREATVAWGTLDLRWRNDSGHPVRIRATSTDTSVTIALRGTPRYDAIRATQGPRTHVTPPGKRTATGPDCEAQTPLEGFDVAVDQVFVRGGQEVKRETYRTHYTPRDEVTCVPDPSASPTATPPAPTATPTATPPAPSAPVPST